MCKKWKLDFFRSFLTRVSLPREEIQINENCAQLDQGRSFNIYNSSAHFKTLCFFSWVMILHVLKYNQDKKPPTAPCPICNPFVITHLKEITKIPSPGRRPKMDDYVSSQPKFSADPGDKFLCPAQFFLRKKIVQFITSGGAFLSVISYVRGFIDVARLKETPDS